MTFERKREGKEEKEDPCIRQFGAFIKLYNASSVPFLTMIYPLDLIWSTIFLEKLQ